MKATSIFITLCFISIFLGCDRQPENPIQIGLTKGGKVRVEASDKSGIKLISVENERLIPEKIRSKDVIKEETITIKYLVGSCYTIISTSGGFAWAHLPDPYCPPHTH